MAVPFTKNVFDADDVLLETPPIPNDGDEIVVAFPVVRSGCQLVASAGQTIAGASSLALDSPGSDEEGSACWWFHEATGEWRLRWTSVASGSSTPTRFIGKVLALPSSLL